MIYDFNLSFNKDLTQYEHIDIKEDSSWFNSYLPQRLYGVRQLNQENQAIEGFASGWGCTCKNYTNLNVEDRFVTPIYDERIDNVDDSYFSAGYVKYQTFNLKTLIDDFIFNPNHDGDVPDFDLRTFRVKSISVSFSSALGSFYNIYNVINYPSEVYIDFSLVDSKSNQLFVQATKDLSKFGLDSFRNDSYTLLLNDPYTYEQICDLDSLILSLKPSDNYSDLPVYIPLLNVELQLGLEFEDSDNLPDDPHHYRVEWDFKDYFNSESIPEYYYYKPYANVTNLKDSEGNPEFFEIIDGKLSLNNVLPGYYSVYNIVLKDEDGEINSDVLFEIFDPGVITVNSDITQPSIDDTVHHGTVYYNFISNEKEKNINKVFLNDLCYFKCNKDKHNDVFNDFYYNKDTRSIVLNTPETQTFINNNYTKKQLINILRC